MLRRAPPSRYQFENQFKIDHTTLSDKGSYLLAQGYGGRSRDVRIMMTPIIDFTATEEHTFCMSFWYLTMGSKTDYGEFFIYMRDWSTRFGGPELKDIFSVSFSSFYRFSILKSAEQCKISIKNRLEVWTSQCQSWYKLQRKHGTTLQTNVFYTLVKTRWFLSIRCCHWWFHGSRRRMSGWSNPI